MANKKKRQSKALVVDADVARSSSPPHSEHPVGAATRQFLIDVLNICHRAVMTPEIADEWKKHASKFARKWRVQMEARKKIVRMQPMQQLTDRIESLELPEKKIGAMTKDIHLIEAALEADGIVVSMDDTARGLFGEASESIGEIKSVKWLNPKDSKASDI